MQQFPEDLEKIRFFISAPHPCGYLPDGLSITLMADPKLPWNNHVYQFFLEYGFRRSGSMVYRPYCPLCRACIPVRVPVARFQPDRSMRRCWKRNQDLAITTVPPGYNEERFELYQRYLAIRHHQGPMSDPTPDGFEDFLLFPKLDVVFHEFRRNGRLVMVAVSDLLPNGISAVYTFYDPDQQASSLGTFSVLWQIVEAIRLGKPYVYLGYLIHRCRKMAYKTRFQPLEALTAHGWSRAIPGMDDSNTLFQPVDEDDRYDLSGY